MYRYTTCFTPEPYTGSYAPCLIPNCRSTKQLEQWSLDVREMSRTISKLTDIVSSSSYTISKLFSKSNAEHHSVPKRRKRKRRHWKPNTPSPIVPPPVLDSCVEAPVSRSRRRRQQQPHFPSHQPSTSAQNQSVKCRRRRCRRKPLSPSTDVHQINPNTGFMKIPTRLIRRHSSFPRDLHRMC